MFLELLVLGMEVQAVVLESFCIYFSYMEVFPRSLLVGTAQLIHVSTEPLLLFESCESLRWRSACCGMERAPTAYAHILEHVPPHLCVCVAAALSLFSPLNQPFPLLLYLPILIKIDKLVIKYVLIS